MEWIKDDSLGDKHYSRINKSGACLVIIHWLTPDLISSTGGCTLDDSKQSV